MYDVPAVDALPRDLEQNASVDSTSAADDGLTAGEGESAAFDQVPLCICGMSMRLPGGISSEDQLWHLLINKQTARRPVPLERYNAATFHEGKGQPPGERHGFFLDHVDLRKFDAAPFSMTRSELEWLDPQVRLMLELTRECFESAGETNWKGRRDVGCYVGTWGDDWKELVTRDPLDSHPYIVTGHMDFQLANRISYEYDLKGPSFVVKSACSSALVALHEACKAIQAGQIRSALVGGANLLLSPSATLTMYSGGLLSPSDTIRTFDASADGYCRAEGTNMIYIKRVDDALRDGNPIRAIIRATATNADGKGEGLFHPSAESHEALIRSCYHAAGITDFAKTAHFECHGTGTKAGDPTETSAIASVFGDYGGISIGSVKPNLGHSEGASGITSIMKSILALENKTILPNANFVTPNPLIRWDRGLRVPTNPTPWPKDRDERISVNAFGLGGSNAHVILESAKSFITREAPKTNGYHDPSSRLLTFSSYLPESVKTGSKNIVEYISNTTENIDDVAYTLAQRREHLPWRSYAVADGKGQPKFVTPAKIPPTTPGAALVFTGQSAQWASMGSRLFDQYPSAIRDVHLMDQALSKLSDGMAPSWNIRDEISKPQESSRIGEAQFSQPLCTALQIILVNILRAWGVSPVAVIGHSSGEIAAAYAVGTLTLEEAIITAYLRGLVASQQRSRGGMAAIGLGVEAVQQHLVDGVVAACENSPVSTTISGDEHKVDEVIRSIKEDHPNIFARRLQVDIAYHSHHMKETGSRYQELLEPYVHSKTPSIPFYSTVTNTVVRTKGALDAEYWRKNLESPVKFNTSAHTLLSEHQNVVLIEIGPHSALAAPLRQVAQKAGSAVNYVPTIIRNEDECQALLHSAGKLYVQGYPLNFRAMMPSGRVLPRLPKYPWHRDADYWHEGRSVREWRTRQHPHHELLGSRLFESGQFEPVWRNFLSLDVIPWCRDHVIARDAVLPATAYLIMACEAMRQLTGTEDYSFRDLSLSSTLLLHESKTFEVVTSLKPVRLTASLDSEWYEVQVSSFDGTSWMKHISAQVKAGPENRPAARKIENLPRKLSTERWYQALRRTGLKYGPVFQNEGQITAHPNKDVVTSRVSRQLAGLSRTEHEDHYHPATLDCCFQLYQMAVVRGLERNCHTMSVPTHVKEIYICRPPEDGLLDVEVAASLTETGGVYGNCLGTSANGQVVFSVVGSTMSCLDNNGDEQAANSHAAARLIWKPDATFKSLQQLIKADQDLALPYELMQQFLLVACAESSERLQSLGQEPAYPFLHHFRRWIDIQLEQARNHGYALLQNSHEILKLDSKCRLALLDDLQGRLQPTPVGTTATAIRRIADQIVGIFNGQVNALDLLRQDDILTSVYNVGHMWDYSDALRLLGHRKPFLRVLEIGAGTGATTELILRGLKSELGDRLYSSYTFTDISAGFFPAAKERFAYAQEMKFVPLDITSDPEQQGFELNSFDLVVAANVLHVTSDLQATLKNVRSLLRLDGKLLLQETCSTLKQTNFVMGVFEGWWLGVDDGRVDEPYISPEKWSEELTKAGFNQPDAIVLDNEKPYQIQAALVASPRLERAVAPAEEVSILTNVPNGSYATAVSAALGRYGYSAKQWSLSENPTSDLIVSILDWEDNTSVLDNISRSSYDDLKTFLLEKATQHKVLWVTKPCQVRCTDPRYAHVIGLTRTLRNEVGLDIATLEADELSSDGAFDSIVHALRILYHETDTGAEAIDPDREFAWSSGELLIPRFHWFSVEEELTTRLPEPKVELNKRLDVTKRGFLQSLAWVEEEPKLEEGEIVVEVKTVGLNFKDILISMGVVGGNADNGSGLGCECSGIVKKVSPQVTDFKVGDRVTVMTVGCFTNMLKTKADLCVAIPDHLSFEEAATMPTVYSTVIYGLLDLARLECGQSVLIHSACGGVGIAAIQICQVIGAEIFATVGSEEKVEYLMQTFGIPRSRIFHSRDISFLTDVMRETNGQGVDVVLNSLSGELLHASWKCVAAFGSMVELGKRDFIGRGRLAMENFEDNRSFFGVHLVPIGKKYPHKIRKILQRMTRLYQDGQISPIRPMKIFDAIDVQEAFRFMQKGTHIGKIVIRMPQETSSLTISPVRQLLSLNPDVSYLLIGGLGGLGRSIATWLVERGAKSMVFMSPNAGKRQSDELLRQELEAAGCSVQLLQGDVALRSDVSRVFEESRLPIAGIIQMSMLLRDGTFESMSHEDWVTATEPKVKGTWNLHQVAVECNVALDFFVLFSSASGLVGQRGQANYAAANTFLDAFVQFRHGQGLAASVLDIGAVGEVGYVSTNKKLLEQNRASANHLLRELDVIDSVELAIKLSKPSPSASQRPVYMNQSQIGLGLKSLKPILSPQNRVIWKKDPRMGLYRNLEKTGVVAMEKGNNTQQDAGLRDFLSMAEEMPRALSEENKILELAGYIRATLAEFLIKPVEDLDLNLSMATLGVDSLVSIELKNWLRQRLALDISVLEIVNSGSLLGLAKFTAEGLMVRYGLGHRNGRDFVLDD